MLLVVRMIFGKFDGMGDDLAHVGQAVHEALGLYLHQHVSERGALGGAADHGHLKRVRGELHQVSVLRASSYDMQALDLDGRHLAQELDDRGIAVGEALVDAAYVFGGSPRSDLSGLLAVVVDCLCHRRGMCERRIVGVDYGSEPGRLAERGQFYYVLGNVLEFGTALLEEPESADVLEEAGRSFDSALVGEILLVAFVGDNRTG